MQRLDFQAAILAIKAFVEAVNGYVTEQEPWELAKDPARAGRLATVLYATAEALRAIAVLLPPRDAEGDARRCGSTLGAEAGLGALAAQPVAADAGEWGQLRAGRPP